MAKRKKAGGKAPSARPGKSRVELRFADELFAKLKALTAQSDVSVNQFLAGLTHWAVENAVVGEPERGEDGFVSVRKIPGVIFFGASGEHYSKADRMYLAQAEDCKPEEVEDYKGKVIFTLDFTERRVVRDTED